VPAKWESVEALQNPISDGLLLFGPSKRAYYDQHFTPENRNIFLVDLAMSQRQRREGKHDSWRTSLFQKIATRSDSCEYFTTLFSSNVRDLPI
jgi:hypothetical protein